MKTLLALLLLGCSASHDPPVPADPDGGAMSNRPCPATVALAEERALDLPDACRKWEVCATCIMCTWWWPDDHAVLSCEEDS